MTVFLEKKFYTIGVDNLTLDNVETVEKQTHMWLMKLYGDTISMEGNLAIFN